MATNLRKYRRQPFRILVELDRLLRSEHFESGTGGRTHWTGLGVRVGTQWFLLPHQEVGEVLRLPKPTRIPGAKPWLVGLANVHGTLLSIVDLNAIFGVAPTHDATNARAVVFRGDQYSTAFIVDEVSGFHQFRAEDQRHELRDEAPEAFQPYLIGAFVGEGNSWLVFSMDRLTQSNLMSRAGR